MTMATRPPPPKSTMGMWCYLLHGMYCCVCVCASVGALCTYTAPNDSFKSTKAFKTVLEIKHFYFISLNFTYQMASKWKITNCVSLHHFGTLDIEWMFLAVYFLCMRTCVCVRASVCACIVFIKSLLACCCCFVHLLCGFIAFANIATHDYASYFKIDARELLSKLSNAKFKSECFSIWTRKYMYMFKQFTSMSYDTTPDNGWNESLIDLKLKTL